MIIFLNMYFPLEVADKVVKNYDYSQTLDFPIEQLTGIDNQIPSGGIRSLTEMAYFNGKFSEIVDTFAS